MPRSGQGDNLRSKSLALTAFQSCTTAFETLVASLKIIMPSQGAFLSTKTKVAVLPDPDGGSERFSVIISLHPRLPVGY